MLSDHDKPKQTENRRGASLFSQKQTVINCNKPFPADTPSASRVWSGINVDCPTTVFERVLMSGRSRLPGGEPRKASQRRTRRGEAPAPVKLNWRPGERVRWNDRDGVFQRDLGDGENAEIKLGDRVYRVRLSELA